MRSSLIWGRVIFNNFLFGRRDELRWNRPSFCFGGNVRALFSVAHFFGIARGCRQHYPLVFLDRAATENYSGVYLAAA